MKTNNPHNPPRFATKVLRWFSGTAMIEDLEGDLLELYGKDRMRFGRWRASLTYWMRVISVIASYALRRRKRAFIRTGGSLPLLHPSMLAFYFKSAFRFISKTPVYSLINVLGLTLGVCACLAIFLIARHEFTFDRFHPDDKRIYRIVADADGPDGHWQGSTIPAALPRALRESVAGLESVTCISRYGPSVSIMQSGGNLKKLPRGSVSAALVEAPYFDILQREWLAGSSKSMHEPFKVVLTESRAKTYFESKSPAEVVGAILNYDDSLQVTVVGVVKDWEENTDFPFTDLISYATASHSFLKSTVMPEEWGQYLDSFQALVKLNPGVSIDTTERIFSTTLATHTRKDPPSPVTVAVKLQALPDVHFNKRGEEMPAGERQIYLLAALAAFILIIASFNFINLSTALSTRRGKEIGIRKTIGAARSTVAMQFLTETFLLTTFSVVLACLLIQPIFRLFSGFIPAGVSLALFTLRTMVFLAILIVTTSLIAGYYPSRVLSSYSPAIVLRKFLGPHGSRSHLLRKSMIVVQFAFSLFFIAGVIVMKSQLQFISEQDRGFRTEGVRIFWTNFDDFSNRPRLLLERIRQIPGVEQASLHGGSPMGFATFMSHVSLSGNSAKDVDAIFKSGDAEYIPLYGIRILAGRNFVESDSLREFVVTESFARALGFTKHEESVGHSLNFRGKDYPIVGVAADFHQHSFHIAIAPVAIGNMRDLQHAVALRLDAAHQGGASGTVLAAVETVFKQFYPDDVFQSHLVEEEIGWMHQDDSKTVTLVNAAMLVTVFISALGVFGLVMFTSEMKIKEIAVRKVLGATVANIATLLGREFVLLLVVATTLAFPLAWYSMDRWLSTFAYRIDMTPGMYLIAAVAALLVGILTVSYHTVKAASTNPARSLRSE
ncbi:MAG TPA: ABC transporter permease [Chryseolinea sp.]|nr:ABC transporter permease [Chryseolinea sp.]